MAIKTRKLSRGKQFEKDIVERCKRYESQRTLVLRKCDPPTRIVGPGRIIFLPNPFLDFLGSWVERDGKSVFLEAKETNNAKLGLGASTNGVTADQLRNLRIWHQANAIAAVIWRSSEGTFLLPIALIDALANKSQLKHIKAQDVPEKCRCDTPEGLKLLSAMRRLF